MAGVSGVFDSGLTAPKKDKPLSFINNDLGGGLFSNIQDDGTTGNLVNKEVNNLLTGNSYDTYKSQSNQKLSRAIANLRNSVGTQYGKSVGQSSYDRAQQKTEQGIFSQIADNNLQADVEKQAMKERGITAAQSLAQAEATNKQNNMQTGMQADTQYGYLDPLTGNRVRGSNELAGTQTDIEQQQANTQRDLGYAQMASSEKISQNQLNESARQYNITNDTDKQQFAATMKLNYDQLSEQQKQFLMGFGLDQAKFEQAKAEYTQNIDLENRKLAQNERIATAQLGLDAQKLAETARQFNISTAEAASQFTQKLNFDYASLSQQEKQFLANLGLDQAKFEESKRQYNLTTSLEDKWRTKDLDLKEQEIANNYSTANSRLEFDKMVQKDNLSEAEKNRIWQAIQNDKQLQNAKDVQQMIINQDQWKQLKVDELTRAGWSVEDARASADRQQQLTIANMQNSLTREVEAGRISQADRQLLQQASQFNTQQAWTEKAAQMGIDEANAQRLWATNERIGAEAATANLATVQGQIQKEITQMGLSMEEAKLLENARQFDTQQNFNTWATEQNMSMEQAKMAWETKERVENNIHQLNMQSLQNAFTEKGWSTEILTSLLQNQQMPVEMAQAYIQDMAAAAGITHTVVGSNGEAIEVPGFENFAQKAYDANSSLNSNLAAGATPVSGVSANEIKAMASGWDTYVEKYPDLFVSADQSLESFSTVSWNSNTDSWKISSEGNTWLNNNLHKLVKGKNGSVYRVEGKGGGTGRNDTSYILLRDINTGKTVRYSSGPGNSEKMNYVM